MEQEKYISDDGKPNLSFIGVGVPRGGTTWMHKVLSYHPEITTSEPKEIHFFNSDHKYSSGFDTYCKSFHPINPNTKMGEFTPAYFYSDDALRRIKHHYPDIKIIVSLRHPVDRAYSNFCFHKNIGVINPKVGFYEFITTKRQQYWKESLYAERLNFLQQLFGESLKIVLFKDIQNDPNEVLKELHQFLGVAHIPLSDVQLASINESSKAAVRSRLLTQLILRSRSAVEDMEAVRFVLRKIGLSGLGRKLKSLNTYRTDKNAIKSARLSEQDRKKLLNIFMEDIEATESFLNRKIPEWKR